LKYVTVELRIALQSVIWNYMGRFVTVCRKYVCCPFAFRHSHLST